MARPSGHHLQIYYCANMFLEADQRRCLKRALSLEICQNSSEVFNQRNTNLRLVGLVWILIFMRLEGSIHSIKSARMAWEGELLYRNRITFKTASCCVVVTCRLKARGPRVGVYHQWLQRSMCPN